MKNFNYCYLILLLLLPIMAHSQFPGFAQRDLFTNQVKARFSATASMFWDGDDGKMLVPFAVGESEVSSLFAAGLWLGVPDPEIDDMARVSISTYGLAGGSFDFGIGPLDANGLPIVEDCCPIYFDQIWQVDRLDVLLFLEDYADNQTIDNPIPASIRLWPGRNNPIIASETGDPLPDQDLAPFFDRNTDGIYNPQDGDYPVLNPATPDIIPDQMLWYVINDEYPHQESNSMPLGVEVQITAYAFSCTDNPVLNTTIFTRHKIINKSGAALEDLKAGFWYDVDLGCYTDDFTGCDTLLNALYAYNQDAIDGTNGCICDQAVNSYCNVPPVQAMTILNHELANMMYYNNAAFGGVPATYPDTPKEYYNFMNSQWADGTPLTTGGSGYDPDNDEVTTFAFPSNPNDPDGWSMFNDLTNAGDRRNIISVPATTLANMESITIDMAYSLHQDTNEDNLGNVNVMEQQVPAIQEFYDNGFSSGCSQLSVCQQYCVWPGDANDNELVEKDDYLAVGVALGNQASGPERELQFTNWFPQDADSWAGTFLDGTNQKHSDCNGSGSINFSDAAVVTENYTLTTPDFVPFDDVEASNAPDGICLTFNRDTITSQGSALQRLLRANVSLGAENDPVEDIYGIAFTIVYDSALIEPSQVLPLVLEQNEFFESGFVLENIFPHPGSNRIDFSFCRTDGQNITSFGDLGLLNFQIRSDATTPNTSGFEELNFKIVNITAIDADENPLDIGYKSDPVVISNLTVTNIDEFNSALDQVQIFPNPNNGTLHFRLPANELEFPVRITLFNLQGQQVMSREIWQKADQWSMNIPKQLSDGLYYLKMQTPSRESLSRAILLNR